jgi:hypothetical protein
MLKQIAHLLQFIELTFRSTPTPNHDNKGKVLVKETSGIFRTGINYANLKPINGQRHALADLWSMRGISLRAACDLQEAEWLIVATWAKPILQVDRYTYPCTLSLFQRQGKQWLKMASQNLPTFATETDPDSEPDTAPARGYNQGERPRQEAIRKWLQGPQPVKAAN